MDDIKALEKTLAKLSRYNPIYSFKLQEFIHEVNDRHFKGLINDMDFRRYQLQYCEDKIDINLIYVYFSIIESNFVTADFTLVPFLELRKRIYALFYKIKALQCDFDEEFNNLLDKMDVEIKEEKESF